MANAMVPAGLATQVISEYPSRAPEGFLNDYNTLWELKSIYSDNVYGIWKHRIRVYRNIVDSEHLVVTIQSYNLYDTYFMFIGRRESFPLGNCAYLIT